MGTSLLFLVLGLVAFLVNEAIRIRFGFRSQAHFVTFWIVAVLSILAMLIATVLAFQRAFFAR